VASGFEVKLKKNLLGAFGARALARAIIFFLIFPHKAGAGCHPIKGNKKKLRSPSREAGNCLF